MDDVLLQQVGATLLLNLGFAWLVGSWFAGHWMRADVASGPGVAAALRRADLWAAGLTVLGAMLSLLGATAVMGGVGMWEACPMFWMMLTGTAYGHAGCVTVIVMIMLFALRWGEGRRANAAVAMLLVVFAATRASIGHAGAQGLMSLAVLAETVHYAAISLWTGAVLVSGWFILGNDRIVAAGAGSRDRYLDRMSQAATLAVIAILLTGVYIARHRVGSVAQLLHTFYGGILQVKMALVGAAVVLGGYNKFFGLPAARRSALGLRTVRTVLRIESCVLAATLTAASIMLASQPPASM